MKDDILVETGSKLLPNTSQNLYPTT